MNIKYPYALLDQCGSTDRVKFTVKEDGSGIILEELKIEERLFSCKIIQCNGEPLYRPINWGKVNPGAGQAGIYRIKEKEGNAEKVALITDYRAAEGDWRIFIGLIAKDEEGLRKKILSSTKADGYYNYMSGFLDYLGCL